MWSIHVCSLRTTENNVFAVIFRWYVQADVDYARLAEATEGYSGDDITNVVRDAAMNGMRRKIMGKTPEQIRAMAKEDIAEPVSMLDFEQAIQKISPSVAKEDTLRHEQWLKEFGSM